MSAPKPPSLDQLRTFLAVFRAGSLSDAARQMRVSQPSVTNHVASLEKWFGKQLFIRSSNGAEPTMFAREMERTLADHLDHIDRFFVGGERGHSAAFRTMSIAGPREYIEQRVLPAIASDIGRLPPLDISFGQSSALLDDLQSGRVDIVISTVRPRHPDIESWPIADEEFWLVAPSGMDVPADSLAQLSAVPTVALNRDLAIIRRYWNSVYNAEPLFDPAITLPDLAGVKTAVLQGFGMTVLPSYMVAQEVADGTLVRIIGDSEPPINTVFLATRKPTLVARRSIAGMARLIAARVKEFQASMDPSHTG